MVDVIPTSPADVTLRTIDRHNVRAVCDLAVRPGQDGYVAPAAVTVAEAGYYGPDSWLRAIYRDHAPAGVVWVLVEAGRPYMVRFMVDGAHQGRGVGRAALELVCAQYAGRGFPFIELSFVPGGSAPPGPFYERCGFAETGEEHGGERMMRRELHGGSTTGTLAGRPCDAGR